MEVLQKTENRTTIPAIPLPVTYPKWGVGRWGRKNKFKKIHTPNVHNSIVYNCQDTEATQVSIDRWMDKEDVIHRHTHTHTEEYYSVIKRRKICDLQQHGWTWRVLKWNKSEKDKYCITSLIWNLKQTSKCNKKETLINRENKLVVISEERQERGRGLGDKNCYV